MTTIYSDFEYVFDSVRFARDVLSWRVRNRLSQREMAELISPDHTPAFVSQVELNSLSAGVTMRTFMRICNVIDKSPFCYFSLQRFAVGE